MDSLKTWNKRTTNKIYSDIKVHLQKEYDDLRQVGALTLQHSKLQPQVSLTQHSDDVTEKLTTNVTNDL